MQVPLWAQYVASLGPLFVLLGALIAAGLAWRAHGERLREDRRTSARDRWWTRTRWAIDQVMKDDPTAQGIGLSVLAVQAEDCPGDAELAIIGAVVEPILERAEQPADGPVEYLVVDDDGSSEEGSGHG